MRFLFPHHCNTIWTNILTNNQTYNNRVLIIRALWSRLLRDGSLSQVAARPFFVRDRHYTTQLTAALRAYPPQKITNS